MKSEIFVANYSTPQEEFWVGKFGDEYVRRNDGDKVVDSNLALFGNILRRAPGIRSILELGCNIGLNLEALRKIDNQFDLTGFEINVDAIKVAREKNIASIVQGTIIEKLDVGRTFDLTFTKTALIHINPEYLLPVYDNLHRLSNRYIVICEYYNPSPVTVTYRGHADRLFKRDFAGELIDRYGLRLLDYGFAYHRDSRFQQQDDPTWFLLEK